jgi:hypothetical protein
MMNWLAFQLPRMTSLDSQSGNDESVSVSVAKTDVIGFPIGRGRGIVKEGCIKENEECRMGLIVLNEKWVNRKKMEMSRGIGYSEGTVQNEKSRGAT